MTKPPPLIHLEIGIQTSDGPFASVAAMVDTGSQITCITEALAKKLKLKLTPSKKTITLANGSHDLGVHSVCQGNLMIQTRDGGASILDGFELVLIRKGNYAVIGLDLLSQFSYAISDGVPFILKQKSR